MILSSAFFELQQICVVRDKFAFLRGFPARRDCVVPGVFRRLPQWSLILQNLYFFLCSPAAGVHVLRLDATTLDGTPVPTFLQVHRTLVPEVQIAKSSSRRFVRIEPKAGFHQRVGLRSC